MTIEQIEIRKLISQMLADEGINRTTLKNMVKDVLDEKIENAIAQALQETDFEGMSKSRIDRLVDREMTRLIEQQFAYIAKNAVVREMQNIRFGITIKRDSGGSSYTSI